MNEPVEAGSAPELVLTVTAVDRLRTLLEQSGDTHRKLRIHARGRMDDPTFTLSLAERAAPDDVELDFVRIAVLLDPESRDRLRGCEIDHRRDHRGEYFVIRGYG